MITKALREWNKASGEDEKSSYSSSNGSFRWIFWRIATTTLALHFNNTI
jgi:hypothetical protein